MQKIDVLLYGFCCFTSTNPQGRVFGGAIYRRVFCVTSWGGGGLYLKGLIFRILRYMAVINLPTNAQLFLKMPTTFMYASFIDWVRPKG